MGDDDTVVLTPEEKDDIMEDSPEDEGQDDGQDDES